MLCCVAPSARIFIYVQLALAAHVNNNTIQQASISIYLACWMCIIDWATSSLYTAKITSALLLFLLLLIVFVVVVVYTHLSHDATMCVL